jgi:dTDP-glucose pyrophosphorylase
MQRGKSVETVENLGFSQESRLIGEKVSNTTRYGVYCFDSPAGQVIRIVLGEQKAKNRIILRLRQSRKWSGV